MDDGFPAVLALKMGMNVMGSRLFLEGGDLLSNGLGFGLVVVGSYEPAVDPANADNLDRTAEILEDLSTPAGHLRVERLPMPDHDDGVWRTYTTIVFVNEVVLVPLYPDYCPDRDERVLATFQRLLPTRRIVGIDASNMIRGGEDLRGITLNVPTGHRHPGMNSE